MANDNECAWCDNRGDWVCCGCQVMACDSHCMTVVECEEGCDSSPHALCVDCIAAEVKRMKAITVPVACHLTRSAKKHHLKTEGHDRCPYCRSDISGMSETSPEYGEFETVEGRIQQKAQCSKCSKKWIDVFKLVDVMEIV